MKKILDTERLTLREFTLEDAQLFIDLNSNPNVVRYTGDGAIETLEKAKEILTTITFPQYENNLGCWAVHLKKGNEFIGWCGLKYISQLNEIDLGYRFFEHHWGKGYATESAKAVLTYGFETLKLDEVVARAAIENINSVNVLKKIGMRFEKEDEEHGDRIYKYRLQKHQWFFRASN
jgi:[ribosomal protein S5]-alanine N-acetyltransferase